MTTAGTIQQFTKMLKNMDRWIETAVEYAKTRGFDPEVYTVSRLAPDQYELIRQVQSACDSAKYAAAYMSGTEAPSHPDTEKTIDELRARIAKAIAFVESIDASKYAAGDDARVSPAWMQGKWIKGGDYMDQVSLPNFYFHVCHVYAILRHNGVQLGKMDYIGGIPMND